MSDEANSTVVIQAVDVAERLGLDYLTALAIVEAGWLGNED